LGSMIGGLSSALKIRAGRGIRRASRRVGGCNGGNAPLPSSLSASGGRWRGFPAHNLQSTKKAEVSSESGEPGKTEGAGRQRRQERGNQGRA